MVSKTKNIVHNSIGHILTIQGDFKKGFHLLKDLNDFTAKCQTADRLAKISPAHTKYIYGNPLPKAVQSLGAAELNFATKELAAELEWLVLSIRKYRVELNLFLTYKDDFEYNFLTGQLQAASEILDRCEKNLGLSLWSLTSKLLIYEYSDNAAEAKALVSTILENNTRGIFTSSLLNFISQKTERRLSAYRYDKDLNNAIQNVKSDLSKSNIEYYLFQLNFFEQDNFTQLKDIIGFDYTNSIIDRYLTFRKLVVFSFANDVEVEPVMRAWQLIARKIDDKLFNTIRLFVDNKFDAADFFDNSYLEILDLYYSGLYLDVCNTIKKYISKGYIDFSLINLYSRSLVFADNTFIPLQTQACVANEIAENIYKVYKKTSNPSEALYNLYQFTKNLDAFDVNFQLATFINIETNNNCNKNYFYLANKKADPIIVEVLGQKPEMVESVMQRIIERTFDSIALTYRLKSFKGDFDSVTEISKTKLSIDRARHYYTNKLYSDSLNLWQQIYEDNSHIPPIMEIAVDYIFRILTEMGQYDKCIKWYVENVIRNPFLVFKIDTSALHKALKKGRFKNVEINIYLPIFISLVSTDDNEKSFSIELFCKSQNARFPSDLFKNPLELNDLTEWFLNKSCNNETLKTYNQLNTTKKRLDERINICEFLLKHFKTHVNEYTEELNLLTNELIIYEGTQKLDESKIYANDQAILKNELHEYEGLYNRYVTIAGLYLKNIKILTVNRNELRYLDKKGDSEYSENEIELSTKSDLDSFYNLFSVIREKFLYSKFGIVTYLSTRIRHGVLLGELRPEFEKHNLIFFKNKLKDRYEPNEYWVKSPALSENEKKQLIGVIADFSSNVDRLIDRIIKENIQIRLDNVNAKGWFNYEFSEIELYNFAVTLYYEANYQSFCKKVLEILWGRTEENLERIQNVLRDEVKSSFVTLINNFDSQVHKVLGSEKLPQIFSSISTCSTSIQIKLDKVATWFKRSGKTHADFRLNTLIDIIAKGVQKAYIKKRLAVTFASDFDKLIKGEYYAHFNDFIRILIENMLMHTIGTTINCTINIRTVGERIIIVFQNDSVSPEKQIDKYREDGKVDMVKLVTEGKSGLPKVLKILKDDLNHEHNDLAINSSDGLFTATATIEYTNIIRL